MAHNLEIINGVASFAENGLKERAWHGLGQVFDRPMYIEEALKACHADYNVETAPIVAFSNDMIEKVQNGTFSIDDLLDSYIQNAKATIRTDNNHVLGLVSEGYGIVQNLDAFKFVDMFCSGRDGNREDTPVIETCGVLGNGERIFVTAKFPESKNIILDNKDVLEQYVTFTTSHDGSGAVRCIVTPIRVVCNNTLSMALRHNSGRISFRHTRNVNKRLDLTNEENAKFAYNALNLAEVYAKELKESLDHLRNVRITEKMLDNILAEVSLSDESLKVFKATENIFHEDIPTRGRNIFLGMKNAVESGVGQDSLVSGNAEWLINGVTTYYQNAANFKNDEAKFESILDGRVAKKVQQVYDYCNAVAA